VAWIPQSCRSFMHCCNGNGLFSEVSVQDGFSLHTNINYLQLTSANGSKRTRA
jgi:hypothetical protein